MKIPELAKILQHRNECLRINIKQMSETNPIIKRKLVDGKINQGNNDFTYDECLAILKHFNATKLQKILLKEHFQHLKEIDYYVIEGTQNFVKQCSNGVPKCCDSCKNICGNQTKTKHPQPYCYLYNDYLKALGLNVYKDYCPYYEPGETEKPIVWYTNKAPTNLDKFGNVITDNRELFKPITNLQDEVPAICGFF